MNEVARVASLGVHYSAFLSLSLPPLCPFVSRKRVHGFQWIKDEKAAGLKSSSDNGSLDKEAADEGRRRGREKRHKRITGIVWGGEEGGSGGRRLELRREKRREHRSVR